MMKKSNLLSRILVAIFFIPFFIFIIFYKNPVYYDILISLAVMLGLLEFFTMMDKHGIKPMWLTGFFFGFSLLLCPFLIKTDYSFVFITAAILIILSIKVFKGEHESNIHSIFITLFGIIYICLLGNFLIRIRHLSGSNITLFLFLITWVNDSGAYFVGTMFGKHKLAPKISPNKTVEGLIGGIFFSILAGIAAKQFLDLSISYSVWIFICFLLGVVGTIGDLAESLLKRFAKVSNSFDLIPGHGGILDKLDSLLFVAPVLYFLIKLKVIF